MRREPTWRIPVGLLALLAALIVYGLIIARYVPEIVGAWPALLQTVVYLVLGLIWLLPLRRFLIWMETGRLSPPDGARADEQEP
ncbi:DUF2842 domain-containing protein [Erythrobacteraceae bacterium CFH 75059]|uniref:DUF2842 domain-containing protein n=1 Tax=Qipengyuania thermophila TaxID=2509361 RepID=UPI0010220FFE|nr:DUF2842 domain-containing protein [Qipengyuania thermophila]TCD05074.1 DUF2842 domain-containing protein [Erythrobacteraceae bacterium CFH 75059]